MTSLIQILDQLDRQLDTMTPEQMVILLHTMSKLDGPMTSLASMTWRRTLMSLILRTIRFSISITSFGDFNLADYDVYHSWAIDASAK